MRETMMWTAVLGVVASLPRVLLFWLMSRERQRIVAAVSESGNAILLLDHHGPGRAGVTLLPGRGDEGESR
ncbi:MULTISPECIES: hypothetical protein [Streptomyces]|uniref:Uncharacterized protein n=1 Tax=Streptomyces tunisiensis TaxID=948699 RepID=A0ABP7ZCG4_9ACTN|nr:MULTISPECIES: hypothetical protein [unclassified Streptomyces]MBJ6613805.1 hypothetical protein [Streptomyces sp. I3(2020)]MBJ6628842.1 hypothetical protein [Streptomyces sp. I4(2020)]MBU5948172.1 hypothetical protein [Streptomyces sp. PAM3C]